MKIRDISLALYPGMAVYKGDISPEFERIVAVAGKQRFTTTMVKLLTHTGTHIDAPSHLDVNGVNIDEVDLKRLVGQAVVVDVTDKDISDVNTFNQEEIILDGKILLVKTGESKYLKEGIVRNDYRAFNGEVAAFVASSGIVAIGIDTLSIDGPDSVSFGAHDVFLGGNIPVIEGLDLENVNEGEYFFICLPLRLKGLDGSPARAIIIEDVSPASSQ
ncbi:MAG: cyclase family protein [Candidatus Hodarchaeales archaeon]